METVARQSHLVLWPGQVPDQRLFRVHAAAAARPETLWRAGSTFIRGRRPLGLACHGIRRKSGTASRPAADRPAIGHRVAPPGTGRAGPRNFEAQAGKQFILAWANVG